MTGLPLLLLLLLHQLLLLLLLLQFLEELFRGLHLSLLRYSLR